MRKKHSKPILNRAQNSTFWALIRYLRCQGRWAPFLYYEQSSALLSCCLTSLFRQDRAFFLLGPKDDHFHAADVQRDPAIPSSILPAPPVSSPCLGANEEIDLQAIGSPSC